MKITSKYTIKKSETNKSSEESLTDDDIINYYLERLITKFSTSGYRLVFVLDELDKIDDDELDDLLKEMKPWLVRGKADFVIVAGQKLTMKYYQLRDGDDELLASLFSKIIHINLLPEYNFEKIFNDFLFKGIANSNPDNFEQKSFTELTELESRKITDLRDNYVYRSKRLPRTFMNLIRQDLRWRNNMAYLSVPDKEYECERKKTEILKNLFEKVSLNAAISETAGDYIYMYLYRLSGNIDCADSGEVVSVNPPNDYPYLTGFLENFRDELFENAAKENLIKLKKQAIPVVEPHKEEEKERITNSDRDKEIMESTKVSNPDLEKFRKDFLSFFSFLLRYFDFFTPVKVDSLNNASFKFLTDEFNKRRVFLFPSINDPILDKNLNYFQSRQGDRETFQMLYSLFESNSIRISSLQEAMFKVFTAKVIKESFSGKFFNEQELKPSLREFAHFVIETVFDNIKSPFILFRYQYIQGSIAVSNEDAGKLVSYLNEYNIMSERGNYIVQILFSSENNGDFEKEEVNAALKVKAIRPDLTDRIRYIILPTSWADELKIRLSKLSSIMGPYETGPLANIDIAKQKSKKGTPKKLQHPSFEDGIITNKDLDDIQKGRWGGRSEVNKRKISAKVLASKDDKEWFYINLKVESISTEFPLTGKVTFYLHDSFNPNQITVIARNNKAELKDLGCYEAFTVGATCDNNTTQLELDLNLIKDAPPDFYY